MYLLRKLEGSAPCGDSETGLNIKGEYQSLLMRIKAYAHKGVDKGYCISPSASRSRASKNVEDAQSFD